MINTSLSYSFIKNQDNFQCEFDFLRLIIYNAKMAIIQKIYLIEYANFCIGIVERNTMHGFLI